MNYPTIDSPYSRCGPGRGFTLIEVMISLALVLLLMYGVSQVFTLTSNAIGANQAVSTMLRDERAAAASIGEDFRNCASDSPLYIINSRIAYTGPAGTAYSDTVEGAAVSRGFRAGFRNAGEQRNNGSDDPTYFEDAPRQFPELNMTDRVPRMDRMGFFTRSLYRRQTTPDNPPATLNSSSEAYVWYGQTAYPKGNDARWQAYAGGYRYLLPENQFGSERILGRLAILLKDSAALNAAASSNTPWMGKGVAANPLWPLSYDSHPFQCSVTSPYSDVAAITMDQFRQDANALYSPTPGTVNPDWFRPMDDDLSGASSSQKIMRFWCDPKISRPVTPQALSQAVPYFLGNCTQFIVEYAGDYVKQYDPSIPASSSTVVPTPAVPGAVVDVGDYIDSSTGAQHTGTTDGVIDYVIDTSADPADPPSDPTKWVRRTRWYGLPRSVHGDSRITINDVVPLADVIAYYVKGPANANGTFNPPAGMTGFPIAPWEKDLPSPGLLNGGLTDSSIPARKDEKYFQQSYGRFSNSDAKNFRYTCAWHNGAPAMIRVLVKIDDPSGKLQDGLWYEYVFTR